LPDPEEELGAARERDLPPGGERLPRDLDCRVDLLDGGEVDRARLLARRRVPDRAAAARRPGNALASDPVVNRLDLGRCDRLRHRSFLLEFDAFSLPRVGLARWPSRSRDRPRAIASSRRTGST